MSKKLYKSRKDKMVGGVCGGIAEYFEINATIIRLVWILLTLAAGTFFIIYIAALVIIPYRKDEQVSEETAGEKNRGLALVTGAGFIIYGVLKLAERVLDRYGYRFRPFSLIPPAYFWPAAIILAGVFIIFMSGRNKDEK